MATEFDFLLKPRTLITAINATKSNQTKIVDSIFSRKILQPNDRFYWEVKTGSETIMRNIKVNETALVTSQLGRTIVTCQAPRFAEKKMISDYDLMSIRAWGNATAFESMKKRIGDEHYDMKQKIDRTREFMAAKALAGQVTNEYGETLVDFNFASEHKPTPTDKWDTANGDPIANIRAWQKLIGQKVGNISSWTAYCGFGVMNALLNNTNVTNLLQYQKGSQIAESGQITNLAGVNIQEYYGSYVDKAGSYQDYIPNGAFILIGNVTDAFGELYAPIVDTDARGEMFYSRSWEEQDPRGRWLMVEARPLPVVFRPEAIVYATVI